MRARSTGHRVLGIALCLVVVVLTGCGPGLRSDPAPTTFWTADALTRIGPQDPPGRGRVARLAAAQGEYESFQVVVAAGSADAEDVDLTVSDLRGPDGATIPAANITRYRQHYVDVGTSSPDGEGPNRPLPPGEYADPLIPFVDPTTGAALDGELRAAGVAVQAGRNQPYWVDVLVPRPAPAGLYRGTYTVSTSQGVASGRVELTVFDFALPEQPALPSSFLNWSGRESVDRVLLQHRLMPSATAVRPERPDGAVVNAGNVGFFSGADQATCAMDPPPPVEEVAERAAERAAPGVLLYNYTADEVGHCPGLTEPLRAWARTLHGAGVAQLVVMEPREDLFTDGAGGAGVDIWVVLPSMYDENRAAVEAALAGGMQVWSYTALVQDDYSPKWQIDFAPINHRIMPGFLNQATGLTGLLYWRVDNWGPDPWNDVRGYGGGYPGEGLLVYPGEEVGLPGGAVPSLRLKSLRDGVEDYGYVALAEERGRGEAARRIVDSVASSWSEWSKDPAELVEARRALARLLLRL